MARDITLDVTIRARTTDADKAAASLEHIDHAAGGAGKSLSGAGGEAKLFNAEIEKSTKRLKEMELQLVTLGNDKGLRKAIRAERSWLSELEKSAKDVVEATATAALPAAISSFSEVFKQVGEAAPKAMMPALIGGIAAAAGALLPGLGAMLGGAVAGAAGTAAMAAGILSATKDAGVKAAAQHFGDDLSHEFFKSDAFVRPVIDSLNKLGTTFKGLNFGDSLAKLAPTVEVIADGLGRLVTNFMPGFNKMLDRMGPFAKVAAEGLADTGQALGDFLAQITKSPGSLEGLRMFFKVTDGLVIMLGESISWLSDRFHEFLAINATVFGQLEDVFDAIGADKLRNLSANLNNLFEDLMGGSSSGVVAITQMKDSLDPFNRYLREAAENTGSLNTSLRELFGVQMSVDEAVIGFERSVDDLTKAIQDNGTSIDARTEKGRAVRSAILDEVSAAVALRDANIKAGMSAADANTQFNNQIAALEKAAIKAGVNKRALEELVGNYVVTVTYNIKTIGKPPSFVQGNLSGPAQDASHRAAGGPVMPGVPYRINEAGSETVTFPAGGTVHPANLTPLSSGGGTVRHVVDLQLNGRTLRTIAITDANDRGIPPASIALAYP